MKIVEELKGHESNHVIINGDGTYPEKLILERICEKYNGYDKVIFYPRTAIKKQTGLSALNSIKNFPGYGFCKIIFIIDGEYISNDPNFEIREKLDSIGVDITEIIPLRKAFLIKCSFSNYNINLYWIISGPETCIEEEVAELIDLHFNIQIDLSGKRDEHWRHRIKHDINQVFKERKKLKDLLRETGIKKLEKSFPNIKIRVNQCKRCELKAQYA